MNPHEPPALGAEVLALPAGTALRRCRARRADLVLAVLAGCPELVLGAAPARPLLPGAAVVCPRGTAWSLAAGEGAVRLLVVAVPAGPERALTELAARPGLDDAARVALAADGGLELVLEPARPM